MDVVIAVVSARNFISGGFVDVPVFIREDLVIEADTVDWFVESQIELVKYTGAG